MRVARIVLMAFLSVVAALAGMCTIALFLVGARPLPRTFDGVKLVYDVDRPLSAGELQAIAAGLQRRVDPEVIRPALFRALPPQQIEVSLGNRSAADLAELRKMLATNGILSFHLLVTDPDVVTRFQKQLLTDGPVVHHGDEAKWVQADSVPGLLITPYASKAWALVSVKPGECLVGGRGSGWALRGAWAGKDQASGMTVVDFEFDSRGGVLFGELTGSHLRRKLAIIIDDRLVSAPVIQSRIMFNGQIALGRDQAEREVKYLVGCLNAGSLPARLSSSPVSERRGAVIIPPAPSFWIAAAILLASTAGVVLLARGMRRAEAVVPKTETVPRLAAPPGRQDTPGR